MTTTGPALPTSEDGGGAAEMDPLWVPCMVCDAPVGHACRYTTREERERPIPHDSRCSDAADTLAAIAPLLSQARADGERAAARTDLEVLERVECQFFACPGPGEPVEDMKTCFVCARVRELQQLLDGPS